MTFTDIQQKVLHAPRLDFGQIFNKSIELFKKVWLQGLIMLLLTIAFAIPFIFIIYMPLILLGIADTVTNGGFETLAPIAILCLSVAYLLFIFASMVVTFGLKAALYRIMRKKDINDEGSDDYFYFLRKPYLGKTINLSLAYFGISLIAALLCFFPLIYVIVPLNLLIVIYAFNPDMSTSDLIKASFELGNKKWLITFGLVIIAAILAQLVGMLMCGIGVFFAACFAYIPPYFIYKEVIGFDDNEIRFLGEHQEA